MKRKDLIKQLEKAGYRFNREGSNHTVYEKEGFSEITVPRHREINENTVKAILKQAGIK